MSTQSHTANRPATSQHTTSDYDISEYATRQYTRTAGSRNWALAIPEQYEPNWLGTCCDRTTAGQVTRRHDAKAASTCAGFSGLDPKMVLWSRGKGVVFRAGPTQITATPGRLPGSTGSGASRSSRWYWR